MSSRLFAGSGIFPGGHCEYRSQWQQDSENRNQGTRRVSGFFKDKTISGRLVVKDIKTKSQCRWCGKQHKKPQKFCGVTCTREFIKHQRQAGNYSND